MIAICFNLCKITIHLTSKTNLAFAKKQNCFAFCVDTQGHSGSKMVVTCHLTNYSNLESD